MPMPVTQEEIRVPHASGVAAVTQVIEQLVASSVRCSAASARSLSQNWHTVCSSPRTKEDKG